MRLPDDNIGRDRVGFTVREKVVRERFRTAKLGGFTFCRGRFMCLDVEAVVVFVVSLAPFQSSLSLCEKELGIRRSRPPLTPRKS